MSITLSVMAVLTGRPRRDTGLVWGTVVVICVGTVAGVWFGSVDATKHALFGRTGSLIILMAALLVTIVGAVVSFALRGASGVPLRWGVAASVVTVAALIAVAGVAGMFTAGDGVDIVMAALLIVGAAAMPVVASQAAPREVRRGGRLPGRDDEREP
jgi:hypothetical protein